MQPYLQIHRWLLRRPWPSIALFLVAWGVACAGLPALNFDLSFRPMFSSSAEENRNTDQFEAVFGRAYGGFVIHLVERADELSDADFIQAVDRLTQAARAVDGISEVISISGLQLPRWTGGEVKVEPLFSRSELDKQEELAAELEQMVKEEYRLIGLVSANRRFTLMVSRLIPPAEDLSARRAVMTSLNDRLGGIKPAGITLHVTGVSWIEAAYADRVMNDQVLATSLTTLMLLVLLFLQFRQFKLVLVCLLPVGFAVLACLGVLGWAGVPITMINSAVPAVILVLGVADAVHMVVEWSGQRIAGANPATAVSNMVRASAKACALTTLTTMVGFLSLLVAQLEVIRSFGLAIAAGIVLAYVANQVLVPWLLLQFKPACPDRSDRFNSWIGSWLSAAAHLSTRRPVAVVSVSAAVFLVGVAVLPFVNADQRFNQELPIGHEVRDTQDLLEREFGGFLGPDLQVWRTDGGSVLDEETRARLGLFVQQASYLLNTQSVSSIQDFVPDWVSQQQAEAGIEDMRTADGMLQQLNERISPDNTRLAVMIRIGDVGTGAANEYRNEIAALASEAFGVGYETQVVGQWWLAQSGMRMIIGDMLRSVFTATLFVLPILWFALRNRRLFIAATVANVIPLFIPLVFMVLAGIKVRIGTAVVMAIALGVVIDNTLHIITRLESVSRDHQKARIGSRSQIDLMMAGTGRAVIYTTLAMVAGFLSMMSNQLIAIRDMGLVAAVTFTGALLADLFLLPALLVLLSKKSVDAPP